MRLKPWTSARPSARAIAAVAVALVHVGIVAMLTLGHLVPQRARDARPFIVSIYSPERPQRKQRLPQPAGARNTLHSRERSTAITYPPVAEGVFDATTAPGALRNTPDCSVENLALLTQPERERCPRTLGNIARGRETDFLDPTVRTQFADDLARKGQLAVGPFHTCLPASRRALMGLSCWRGMDN